MKRTFEYYYNEYIEIGLSPECAKEISNLRLLCDNRTIKRVYSYSNIENKLLRFTESFGHTNKQDSEFSQTFISSIQPLYGI